MEATEQIGVEDLRQTGATESGMRIIPPQDKVGGVFLKIAKVMADVETVAKRGHNKAHDYDYAMEADIVDELRPIMAKHKIVMIPHQSSERNEIEVSTRSGKASIVRIHHTFGFYDAEDGSAVEIGVWGEGFDSLDKASYKAFTGAEKYALLKIFMVATGDDPEADQSNGVQEKAKGTKDKSSAKNKETAEKIETARKIKAVRTEISKAIKRMNLGRIYIGHFLQTTYSGIPELVDEGGKVDVALLSLEQFETLLGAIEMAEKAIEVGQDVTLDRWDFKESEEKQVTIAGLRAE